MVTITATTTAAPLSYPSPFRNVSNNNNNSELIERFQNLKVLYNLKTYNAQIPIIIQINSIQMYETYEN